MGELVTSSEADGGPLNWAVCASCYPGQSRSGDAFLVRETASGPLVAVVDGLGHGADAADAAERALTCLRDITAPSPIGSLTSCHQALRGSRGAAVTLAALDLELGRVTWAGVGNVEAAVLRPGQAGRAPTRWSVPMRGGVVGDRLPVLRESAAPLQPDDVLVLATDGLVPAFLDAADPSVPVAELARRLHRDFARGDDDALVLVARPLTHRISTGARTPTAPSRH